MNLQKPQNGSLVAHGDKDTLRSLFHLFVGKPDSTQKIFTRAVYVSPQTLLDLNERVQEKLKTHHLEGMVAAAYLSFEDKTAIDFGGWAEFEAFRWTSSKTTKEVRLSWHFLLTVQGYEMPQQHALTVKLCADAKPFELLQAMLSKHPAEDDNSPINFAPTVCRVDFISHSIGQELITVVEDWNAGLPQPETKSDFFSRLEDHKKTIAQAIDYSTPVLFAIASLGVLRKIYPVTLANDPMTVGVAVGVMSWLIGSLIAIYLSEKLSKHLANSAHHALEKYGMHSMFRLTNGDENRNKKIKSANKKQVRSFVISTALSFALNVAAGIFTAVHWPTGA